MHYFAILFTVVILLHVRKTIFKKILARVYMFTLKACDYFQRFSGHGLVQEPQQY